MPPSRPIAQAMELPEPGTPVSGYAHCPFRFFITNLPKYLRPLLEYQLTEQERLDAVER